MDFNIEYYSNTISWLANRIEIKKEVLQKILASKENLYEKRVKKIGKKKRELLVPCQQLKEIQKKIDKILLTGFPKHENAFGFFGGGIINAIEPHLNMPILWSCDIKDAFPSTLRYRVINALKTRFSPALSYLLARLTTSSTGRLPQGAPTSPRLFDICMQLIDKEFSVLAEKNKGKYTRYADNIFFSAPEGKVLELEKEIIGWFQMAELTPHKIRVKQPSGLEAMRMLGLNIRENKVHNTRNFKNRIRLSIHHLNWLLDNNMKNSDKFKVALMKLQGQMAFARKDTLPKKLLDNYSALEKRLN